METNKIKYLKRYSVIFILAFAQHSSTDASTIYEQVWDGSFVGPYSDVVSNTTNSRDNFVADNFSLSSSMLLSGINWMAGYTSRLEHFTPVDKVAARLQIFESFDALSSGNALYETEASAEYSLFAELYPGDYVYELSISLNSPLTLSAGNDYWISIVETDTRTYNGLVDFRRHLWTQSNDGDSTYAVWNDAQFGANGEWTKYQGSDQAFSLQGTEVPLPPSLFVFASGLGIMLGNIFIGKKDAFDKT